MGLINCECGGRWRPGAHLNYGFICQSVSICDHCGARKKSPPDEIIQKMIPKEEAYYEDD